MIWLTPAHIAQIQHHAQHDAPQEACGLLLGTGQRVTQVLPAENRATTPHTHYRIDDRLVAQHYRRIIGFYHSHPAGEPIPSETDLREAWTGGTVYLIVGKGGKLAAWQFEAGRVLSVALHIADHPPVAQENLSRAQHTAILVSAAAAVIFVLIVALSLLPPAPPVP